MAVRLKRMARSLWRLLRHLCFMLVLLAIAFIVAASTAGLPAGIAQAVVDRFANPRFTVEVGGLRLRPLEGVTLEQVRVYRKGRVGPAAMAVQRLAVDFSAIRGLTRRPAVRRIAIEDGRIEPAMLTRLGAEPGRPRQDVTLAIALRGIDLQGVGIDTLSGDLKTAGRDWSMDNLQAKLTHAAWTGRVSGRVTSDPLGGVRATLEGNAPPHVFLPLMRATDTLKLAERLTQDFAFEGLPPRWEVQLHVGIGGRPDFEVDVRFWLEELAFRGVDLMRADGRFVLTRSDGKLTASVEPLLLVREEGLCRGGLAVYARDGQYVMDFHADSALQPYALTQMAGVWRDPAERPFRFEAPYKVVAEGQVKLGLARHVAMTARAALGGVGLDPILLREATFDLVVNGPTNRVENLQGNWCGGVTQGRVELLRLGGEQGDWIAIEADVRQADFERIAQDLLKAEPKAYEGRLALNATLNGLTGAAHRDTLRGTGALKVTGGKLFMLPVFGGLSDYLSRLIPGLDFLLTQSDLRTDFTIADGKVRSDVIRIEGDILSLLGKGDAYLDGRLDYNVQLTFLKSHTLVGRLVRVPTYLFSKLFEFRLHGTRGEPKWYPLNFSLEGLGIRTGSSATPADKKSEKSP